MIAIIDYEMGNLRSVQKGFERVGHAATITSDPAVLADARQDRAAGRRRVSRCDRRAARTRQLVEPIRAAIDGRQAVSRHLPRPAAVVRQELRGRRVRRARRRAGRGRAFQRAGRVQGAAHGLEPGAIPPPAADLRRHRRRRALLLRALVLRRAARRVGRRHRDRTMRSRSARASGATICSPCSSIRRRARRPACGC